MSAPTVGVILPYFPNGDHRRKSLEYVERWWSLHTDFRVTRATGPAPLPLELGDWSKAAAIRHGAAELGTDIAIMADADVVLDSHQYVRWAIDTLIRSKLKGWAIPHTPVIRLTQLGTTGVLSGTCRLADAEVAYTHRGMAGGGMAVMATETMLAVPPDPRFVGWGNEDESWAMALTALVGRPARSVGHMYHLWHPRAPRLDPFRGSLPSAALRDRYKGARGNPRAMRTIIDEIGTLEG